ncbi:MAG: hypothetical protein U0031_01825 [Thermomicrobiales bacterium]
MEPRPPRPRSSRPFEGPGAPAGDGIGERLYPAPGEFAYSTAGEAQPSGPAAQALLPRRQRRQRGFLRGILATLAVVGLIALAGWFFRDTIRGLIAPPPPPPTPVVAAVTDQATPSAVPESAALPNALATVTPTPKPAATATPKPAATNAAAPQSSDEDLAARDRNISVETLPLLDLLPTQDQVPAGLVLADEAERSKADVVAALGGTEEAAQHLDDWGWSGNAFRDFIADEDSPPATGTTFLNASVHRFADAESAANALTVFSDYVIVTQGLQNVESPAIGDAAILLVGAPDGVPLAVLYAQKGTIMYRIGASSSSAGADPTSDVLAVAQAIIPGQASGG